MASFASRRLANSLTWSFNFSTRSKSFAFSFTQKEHPRQRRHAHSSPLSQTYQQQYTRAFSSSRPSRYAEAEAATGTSNSSSRPATSGTTRPSTFTRPTTTPTQTFQPRPREPLPPTTRNTAATAPSTTSTEPPITSLTSGLSDAPPSPTSSTSIDWTTSSHGLSNEAFPKEAADILLAPVSSDDIEIKPDGILYLPEIKYRRILNRAFGPGAWGMAPRGETIVTGRSVTREYALLVFGRLVSTARGEQDYFDPEGIPTATEGCKSNALMRCCKDLGVASELWDPRFIRKWLKENAREAWVENVNSKKRKKITLRRDDEVRYPFKEVKM